MGYSGDFVLVRSDSSLPDLPVFDDPEWCVEERADYFHECWPRPEGWQTLQVNDYLPENGDDRWLHRLVTATGSPVMIASVMDSDVCYVRGLTPSGVTWSTFLDPVMAADYEVSVSPPSEDEAPPGRPTKTGGSAGCSRTRSRQPSRWRSGRPRADLPRIVKHCVWS